MRDPPGCKNMSVTEINAENSNAPAWKRLGLKLKRDEDGTLKSPGEAVNTAATYNEDIVTRKRSLDSESDAKRGKRRKTHPDITSDPGDTAPNSSPVPKKAPKLRGDHVAQGKSHEVHGSVTKTPKHIIFDAEQTTESNHHDQDDSRNRPSNTRRKSVTFTPDTKNEDGFSASNFLKSWSAQQGAEPSIDPDAEATNSVSSTPSKKAKKKSGSKDSAKRKDPPAAKTPAQASDETPAYVSYLTQFHQDRANWKFNKNKQTDLLKHIFSLDRLPAALTPAIVAYISGLGGASARRRVHDEATEIMSAIASDPANRPADGETADMSTPEARHAAYVAAFQRQVERYEASGAGRPAWAEEQLEEIRAAHERGLRAEAILRELLLDELRPGEREGNQKEGSGGGETRSEVRGDEGFGLGVKMAKEKEKKKKKKNRKSRTEVSDSSSSDSADSSDEIEDEKGAVGAREAGGGTKANKTESKPIFDKELLDKKFGKKKQG